MAKSLIIQCPQCGQHLRIPENIGGMLMACTTCGQKLYSDFKLHSGSTSSPNVKKSDIKDESGPPNKPTSGFSIKV